MNGVRGEQSKRLTVLSYAERVAMYSLPYCNDFQRVHFLAMTDAKRTLAFRRKGLKEQIYCLLQIGYFKDIVRLTFENFPNKNLYEKIPEYSKKSMKSEI